MSRIAHHSKHDSSIHFCLERKGSQEVEHPQLLQAPLVEIFEVHETLLDRRSKSEKDNESRESRKTDLPGKDKKEIGNKEISQTHATPTLLLQSRSGFKKT